MEEDKKVVEGEKVGAEKKGGCRCFKKKNRKFLLLGAAIIVVILVISVGKFKGMNVGSFLGAKTMTPDAAKAKVIEFIKNDINQPDTKVDVKDIVLEDGLYKLTIVVGEQMIPAYMAKDGSKLFPNVIELDVKKEPVPEEPENIPTSAKPTVDLYVMSFCPFGNKAEDTLKPAYELLKNKVDFNFRYIVSTEGSTVNSLHGQKEVDQNEREACVLKSYGKDKWFSFVTYVNTNCGTDGACWEAGAKELSLDAAKIKSCVTSQGLTLMQADEKASTGAGAQGSPTMIINGVSTKKVYQYGNSESYKKAICDAFTEAPAECAQELSSTASSAQGGSCN